VRKRRKDNKKLIECDKCDGVGYYLYFVNSTFYLDKKERRYLKTCDKCGGYGLVDWVENMRGKTILPTMKLATLLLRGTNRHYNKRFRMSSFYGNSFAKNLMTSYGIKTSKVCYSVEGEKQKNTSYKEGIDVRSKHL
jgi:hypothetical protein